MHSDLTATASAEPSTRRFRRRHRPVGARCPVALAHDAVGRYRSGAGAGEELDLVAVHVVGQDRPVAAVAFRVQGHRLAQGPPEQSQEPTESVQALLPLDLEQADIDDDLVGTPWPEGDFDVRVRPSRQ